MSTRPKITVPAGNWQPAQAKTRSNTTTSQHAPTSAKRGADRAALVRLEQVGGPEYDFKIELPRREVWSAEINLED